MPGLLLLKSKTCMGIINVSQRMNSSPGITLTGISCQLGTLSGCLWVCACVRVCVCVCVVYSHEVPCPVECSTKNGCAMCLLLRRSTCLSPVTCPSPSRSQIIRYVPLGDMTPDRGAKTSHHEHRARQSVHLGQVQKGSSSTLLEKAWSAGEHWKKGLALARA